MRNLTHLSRANFTRTRVPPGSGPGRMAFCFPFTQSVSTLIDTSPSRRWDSEAIGSGITVAQSGLFGMRAMHGDGTSNAYIRLRSLSDTDPPTLIGGTDKFTFACWAKFTSFAATRAVYGESASTAVWTTGDTLYISTAGKTNLEYYNGAYVTLTGTAVLTAGLWYHLAFTRGTGGRRTYVNGAVDGTNTDTANANNSGGSMLMCSTNVAGSTTAGNPMLGDMCGVVAFNDDMGAGFIKRLYQEPLFLFQSHQRKPLLNGTTGIANRGFFPGFI